MIVLDASTLAKFILKEPGWENLTSFVKEGVSVDHIFKEVANSVWKAYYMGYISLKDAKLKYEALRKLLELTIEIADEKEVMNEAFHIAIENKITIYDALYIALAKVKKLKLVTSDSKQANIAKEIGIKTSLV